jgi:protein gp37
MNWKLHSERKIDWVIVGGESGPGARPMYPQWVRNVRDQCVAAGVSFFFKQWGSYVPDVLEIKRWMQAGWNPMAPKHGRILDGREWNEMPDATR